LSVALVAVGIGLRLAEGRMDLQTGLLILVLAPEAYLPLRMVGVHFHASAEGMTAAQRAFDVLETPRPATGTRPAPRPVGVVVEGLTVEYPGRDRPALDGVGLHLRRGDVVALAGPSGAGKSSLVAALMGFVQPSSGRVVLEAEDSSTVLLADTDHDLWCAHVGWSPQRPHLFAATLAENLRLARPDATDAELLAALSDAAADDLLGVLPDGLATRIGEGGHGLSAGQRRRVALARALLRDAPVMLLDEPTADLDAATEQRVLATLQRRARSGAAVLVVAHRPELLAWADRVVVLGTSAPAREVGA
jgi:ABC-type transport system involved in cytochrome bd biosynthesis fused ATPase/permease subunit